jgi:CheY-like chemotaxis protein
MRHVHSALVVDDDDTAREALVECLRYAEFDVRNAATGNQALRELFVEDGWRPCALVVDLVMPDVDGWTLIERVRREPHLATLPIIVLSGDVHRADEANRRGVDAFVAKPAAPVELIETVARHCRHAATSQDRR